MTNEDLIDLLKNRFLSNMNRHKNLEWPEVEKRLRENNDKFLILHEMENTGGEPDVIGRNNITGEYVFYDCSKESPKSRRNTSYDLEGEKERNKKNIFPNSNAISMSEEIGIEILSEEEYIELQKLGDFDLKTSSWLKTPSEIRKLGGAIFGDKRYNHVFIYHNGAGSFYGSRGFRGKINI